MHHTPIPAALVRQSETIELVTVLLHIRIVECSPTHTTSAPRAVEVVDAARLDELVLHSAVLTGLWKHVGVNFRTMQRALAVRVGWSAMSMWCVSICF